MAALPIFDFAVPNAGVVFFTDGERAMGIASTANGAPDTGTFYLTKFINVPAGVYRLKLRMMQTGSLVIAGNTIPAGFSVDTQIDLPAGPQRLDMTLVKVAAGECYTVMSLSQVGKVFDVSNAADWIMSDVHLADGDVPQAPDPRMALPVFGLLPNWQGGITERVEYLTDIMTSETADEQRRALREYPRRSFEASFMRADVQRASLDQFFVGIGRASFMMPLWHEQYRTTADIVANEGTHSFPTTGDTLDVREFMVNDLVLITNGNPLDQEVVSVSAIDSGTSTLTWALRPSRNWPAGARLIPMRRVAIVEKAAMSNIVDSVATVTVRFELQDPMTNITPSWGGADPIWDFDLDWSSAMTVDYDRTVFTLDNTSGPVVYTDPAKKAEVSTRVNLTMFGRQKLYALRRFIAAARGKAIRFYAPSFTNDLKPIGDLSGGFVDVHATGFTDIMKTPQWARKIIAVIFNDGSPTLYRTITSSIAATVDDTAVERLFIDTALPAITYNSIARVQFIVPTRFDQDGFEFTHLVDNSAATRTALVLRSMDGTGMATL